MFLVAGGKMRAIFAISHGAGVVLLASRLEVQGVPAPDIHYRCNLWRSLTNWKRQPMRLARG